MLQQNSSYSYYGQPNERNNSMKVERDENNNVYVNITITGSTPNYNGTTQFSNEDNIATDYNTTKTIPILDKCSDYYASIVRFSIPLNTIPLLICPIIPLQGNPNLTPLVFGIFYNGSTFSLPVIFMPSGPGPAPAQNQFTQVITPYYYIYYYEQFINMVNYILSVLWILSGLSVLFDNLNAPYYYYDPITTLVNLVLPACFFKLTAPAAAIPILFYSESSIRYFDAFPTFFNGYNQPNGRDFDLNVASLTNVNNYAFHGSPGNPFDPTITNPPTYYQIPQDYPTIFYWSSIRSLLITTNNIPIKNEFIPTLSTSSSNNSNNSVASSFPIITDFIPNLTAPGESRAIAYYFPLSQYKLVDMTSDNPLQKIDLHFYWQDTSNNLYPLQISLFQEINVKLGFFKKSLYKPMNPLLYK